MDYKKKYKEALERAKNYYVPDSHALIEVTCFEDVFPELAKSEDETIRKELVYFIQKEKEYLESKVNRENSPKLRFLIDALAYLEKQKINTEGDFARGYDCGYEACLNSHGAEWYEKQKEQVMDETDKIAAAYQLGRIDERKEKEQKPVEKQDYSGLNDLERAIHRGFLCAGVENVPVTIIKETAQDCLAYIKPVDYAEELKKCKENPLYFYDKYVKIKMKPMEWSKEDEEVRKDIIAILEQFGKGLAMTTREKRDKMVSWMRNLRPSWKPSEEQMEALDKARRFIPYNCDILESLYNDLKKLMED